MAIGADLVPVQEITFADDANDVAFVQDGDGADVLAEEQRGDFGYRRAGGLP